MPQSFRPAFNRAGGGVDYSRAQASQSVGYQPAADDERRVEEALRQLSIADLRPRVFCSLSGGQQQLVLSSPGRWWALARISCWMNPARRWICPTSSWCCS